MHGDVVWNLQAIPLTPIHVGDGTTYQPDGYDLREGHLCRFDPHRVMREMGAEQRRLFNQALDGGRLQEAQAILRRNADDAHVEARIPVAEASAGELRKAFRDDRRYGLVSPFVRTGGQPYLPGSTVKGALRTAWLSQRAGSADRRALEGAMADGPARSKAERAELFLLERDRNRVEQDPFRYLHVPDVPLDGVASRIDQIVNWRPETARGEGAENIQLHVERLLSLADGTASGLKFQVRLAADSRQEALRRRDERRTPRVVLLADELWQASREFHWRLFERERARFWDRYPETRDRLAEILRFRFAGRDFDEAGWRATPSVALMRLGRFGHFESKSLECYRSQVRPQDRTQRPVAEGATRMIVACTHRQKTARVPLGWMLLMRLKDSA